MPIIHLYGSQPLLHTFSNMHFLDLESIWKELRGGSKESVNYFPLQQSYSALCAPILKYINVCLWLGTF